MKYYVGIDIGGTKINVGILDEQNNLVTNKIAPVPSNKDCENVLKTAKNTLTQLCDENGLNFSDIYSVGIGIPGTVSKDNKIGLFAPNLDWKNEPISDIFYKLTGVSAKVLQDSRAGAYGEYMAGNGKDSNVLICITLGTGIGTGLVIGGEIFNGGLAAAGELGHFPAIANGRPCGCGKNGCLECYAAGKGLDQTARELYGEDKNARTLFEMAEQGDEKAITAINQAVEMLGRTVVSAINLISPDCLIFSGGLSAQTKLYLNPLIDYIKAHSYKSGDGSELKILTAYWKEHAPMIGAALFAKENTSPKPMLSASVMCADLLNFGADLENLQNSGVDMFHIDMMDGNFVPNYMLPPELVKAINKVARIPLDIHLMVNNPDLAINMLELKPEDYVTVHYESTNHIKRTLSLIKAKGAKAGVAINPGTPLSAVEELLGDIDMLLIMTVNPGFAGQKLVEGAFDKISRARKMLDSKGLTDVVLEVDGNCSFENIPKMHKAGAGVFVVGTSSVFHKDYTYQTAIKKVFDSLEG